MRPAEPAAPLLDGMGIAALLPHQGAMCLIDSVDQWSVDAIVCSSLSHLREPHPLARDDGSVGAACGVEYAAQAMALHAALTAQAAAAVQARNPPHATPPADRAAQAGAAQRPGAPAAARLPVGMLAGVRALSLQVARLDDITAPLRIEARLESGDPRTAVYAFALHADDQPLLAGRATVILDATGLLP